MGDEIIHGGDIGIGADVAQPVPDQGVNWGGVATGALGGAAAGTAIFPGIGTAVGGVIGAGGALLSNLMGNASAKRQMEYQERLSGTAHQREVNDLRAAGLNPILSARLGGSSTPPGATFQPSNMGEQLGSAIGNSAKMYALELPALESSIRQQAAQSEAAYASAESSRADAVLKLGQAQAVMPDIRLKDATRHRIEALTKPEVGETLAHAALMREQRNVQEFSARNIQEETELAKARAANERARLGRVEWESSPAAIGLDALGQVGETVSKVMPGGKIGRAVFGGPSSAKRVRDNLKSMNNPPSRSDGSIQWPWEQ